VRARFQNVYGPREILGAGRWRGTSATVWRNVTPTFVYRCLRGLPLVLDNGGQASRDFVYVGDVVNGLLLCATAGEPGDVYNLASGAETTIHDLALLARDATESDSEIVLGPARDWDRSGHRFGSTTKARLQLGFTAATSLEDGMQETVSWTRANLPLIDSCIERHAERLAEAELMASSPR